MNFLPFEMNYLTEEMIVKARNELGETEEIKHQALKEMRRLIQEDKMLECSIEDNYLLGYLRSRKYDIDKTIGLLRNYYSIKKSYKDVYGEPDYDGVKKCIEMKMINVLPYRDFDGTVFILLEIYRWNVKEMKMQTLVHAITCVLLACVEIHPATQICGLKIIFDLRGMGVSYTPYLSIRLISLIAKGFTNALPIRLKAIHCINESQIIQYFWNILKRFLTLKMRARVIYHTSTDTLIKHINPDLLPEQCGGNLKYDNTFWLKFVYELQYRYYEMISYGYKSSKKN